MSDLVIDRLTVEYTSGGFPIRPLDNFSATVTDGSLAVLLGPSGCGKTTLLSCLGGILTPTGGEIRYDGTTVTALRGAELTRYRRHGVGIVFQAFNLVPSLNALDNVAAPLLAAGRGRTAARARARELLARVGLADRLAHHPDKLSGGQQQRVSMARALALDPGLIIADEPTANLDYIQVETVLQILRELAVPGRVVVVATHDDRLLPLADQVVQMAPEFHEAGQPTVDIEVAAGEWVFTQGSRGNRIYTVTSGAIEISRTGVDGQSALLARLGPGEHFGEVGAIFELPRSAGAQAVGPTHLTSRSVRQFRGDHGELTVADLLRRNTP